MVIKRIRNMERKKTTAFSIDRPLLRKIDADRGMIPRSAYVEMLIRKGIQKMEEDVKA